MLLILRKTWLFEAIQILDVMVYQEMASQGYCLSIPDWADLTCRPQNHQHFETELFFSFFEMFTRFMEAWTNIALNIK